MKNLFFILLPVFFSCLVFSCRKESFTGSQAALLRTSADTLHFDTLFTSTGSISQSVKIINDNDKGIHISSVKLAGGNNSPFRINVDGLAGPQVGNIDIGAEDSAYIFVTASINPNASDSAFIIRDSIEISYNGNIKYIQLDAFGRNAHFFRNKVIRTQEVWNNDLPYVILGKLVVDTNASLVINKGCRIYIHADAPFIVNGTLTVNGEQQDSTRVVFTGDRMDVPYRDFPASFPGLYFTGVSHNSILRYAVIKNAYQGIVAANTSGGNVLTLQETIIDNAYDAGLLGIKADITARNLLVSNCGKNIQLLNGGNYDFTHCTAAAWSNAYVQHKDPILTLSNYLGNSVNSLNAVFRNCIFWSESNGLVNDEVAVLRQGSGSFHVSFSQVLWRVQKEPENIQATGIINNQNPLFDSINTSRNFYSFRLKQQSPCVDRGMEAGVNLDLDGNLRPVGLPDLGAYEKQ